MFYTIIRFLTACLLKIMYNHHPPPPVLPITLLTQVTPTVKYISTYTESLRYSKGAVAHEHAMKAHRGSRCVNPLILILGAGWQ